MKINNNIQPCGFGILGSISVQKIEGVRRSKFFSPVLLCSCVALTI